MQYSTDGADLHACGVFIVAVPTPVGQLKDAVEFQRQYGMRRGEIGAGNPLDALVLGVAHAQHQLLTPQDIRALCKPAKPVVAYLKSLCHRHELMALG